MSVPTKSKHTQQDECSHNIVSFTDKVSTIIFPNTKLYIFNLKFRANKDRSTCVQTFVSFPESTGRLNYAVACIQKVSSHTIL